MENIGNIVTFAEAYFDRSFQQKALGEVDSLILCNLSYYQYKESFFEKTEFENTVQEFLLENPREILKGLVSVEEDRKLRDVLRKGGRHGNLKAANFAEIVDVKSEKQFSAITFDLGNGEYYISFRGTDSTVTGWREDFNLSFCKEVPAQEEAVSYAMTVMGRTPGNFYLGGHSKGGNLAVFCAANLPWVYQERLLRVYNHDGPGFLEEFYESAGYKRVRLLIQKTVPESSVIGMILEEDEIYHVVKSNADGLMQHDPFSWIVEEDGFVRADAVDNFSFYTNRALRRWLESLDFEERERIVDTVFDVIAGTGINEFDELSEHKRKRIKSLFESAAAVKPEDRKLVFTELGDLLSLSVDELQLAIKTEGAAYIEKRLQKLREEIRKQIEKEEI